MRDHLQIVIQEPKYLKMMFLVLWKLLLQDEIIQEIINISYPKFHMYSTKNNEGINQHLPQIRSQVEMN